jgi:acyl-CoA synthetase (AMP-forming)/AMP-acid ligase II
MFVDALDKTSGGKIDKKVLRANYRDGQSKARILLRI